MFCSKSQVWAQLHEGLVVFYTPVACKEVWQIIHVGSRKPVPFWGSACRVGRMSPAMTLFRQFNPTLAAYLQPELSNPTEAPSGSTRKAKEQSKTAGSD